MNILDTLNIVGHYKQRAEAAEAKVAAMQATIDGIHARIDNRAALIAIVRRGRMIRLSFARNGKLHIIELIGSWSDDIDQWKKDLLDATD